MTNTLTRRAVTGAATLALLTGGAIAMAPTASAVGSSACQSYHKENEMISGGNVKYRTGPSTSYTAKGILTNYTDIYVYCLARGYAYVKPLEGSWKGTTGWVSSDYVTGLYNL
jgi:uncharacterized protein YraI